MLKATDKKIRISKERKRKRRQRYGDDSDFEDQDQSSLKKRKVPAKQATYVEGYGSRRHHLLLTYADPEQPSAGRQRPGPTNDRKEEPKEER